MSLYVELEFLIYIYIFISYEYIICYHSHHHQSRIIFIFTDSRVRRRPRPMNPCTPERRPSDRIASHGSRAPGNRPVVFLGWKGWLVCKVYGWLLRPNKNGATYGFSFRRMVAIQFYCFLILVSEMCKPCLLTQTCCSGAVKTTSYFMVFEICILHMSLQHTAVRGDHLNECMPVRYG